MNQIQYFKHQDGLCFAAISQDFYESVTFWQVGSAGTARIELEQYTISIRAEFYQSVKNGYQPCSQDEYFKARLAAQNATARFFGERLEFQTPPVRNTASVQGLAAQAHVPTVTLCTGEALVNDLPF